MNERAQRSHRRVLLGALVWRWLPFRQIGISLLVACGWVVAPPGLAQNSLQQELAAAQTELDDGNVADALAILQRTIETHPRSAQALLLRSSASFIAGQRMQGRSDLEAALQLDPGLRQGWLNLGALELAERRFPEAIQSFERARDLEPEALDNDLNLGAAWLFDDQIDQATELFARYAARSESPGDAHFLIAKNYVVARRDQVALDHLEAAIAVDERQRLLARMDASFDRLRVSPRFQRLLETDSFVPGRDSLVATFFYPTSYEPVRAELLGSVVDALRELGIVFDSRIEVAQNWSLVWGDLRVKVSTAPDGQGLVELSAAPDRYAVHEWSALTERIDRQIDHQLSPRVQLPEETVRRLPQRPPR